MKTHHLPCFRRYILIFSLISTGLIAARADEASTQPATNSPPLSPTAPVAAEAAAPVSNLILTLEIYKLSQTEGANLLQENTTDQARYDHLRNLVKEGKARLDTLLCGAGMLNEQTAITQQDLMSYAITFGHSSKNIYATDFKKRGLGYRFVFRARPGSDNQGCSMNMVMDHSVLKDFADQILNDQTGSFTASLPEFDSPRITNGPLSLAYDQIHFVGTLSEAPEESTPPKTPPTKEPAEDSKMTLVFGKASQVQLDPGTTPDAKPIGLEHQFSLYSMSRDKAQQILSQKQTPDSAFQAVQALVKTNEAKLEHLSILRTYQGNKSAFNETTEMPYLTNGANATEQDIGFAGELKATPLAQTQLLTLDVTECHLINYLGNLPVTGLAASYNGSQPVFEVRNIQTALHCGLGEHELLGTFNSAGDTGIKGQKDNGRVCLEFIRTTAITP
jgi:hypothetical protein